MSRPAISAYWDQFYSRKGFHVPADPSPFAVWVEQQLDPQVSIIEIGCGNGRDAHFFGKGGRRVIAVDQSAEAIKLVKESAIRDGLRNLYALATTVSELADSESSVELRRLSGDGPKAVYARFFLHAITEPEQNIFLQWLRGFLLDGEYSFLEFRAADLSADQYEFGVHYRRPIAAKELAEQVESLGFEAISASESRDYSPYLGERPLVGRVILRRNKAERASILERR
jgi:SAM-dependent methyltransferase